MGMPNGTNAADGVTNALLDEFGVGLADGPGQRGYLGLVNAIGAAGDDHHGNIVGKAPEND